MAYFYADDSDVAKSTSQHFFSREEMTGGRKSKAVCDHQTALEASDPVFSNAPTLENSPPYPAIMLALA
jgi:hypothetical protein